MQRTPDLEECPYCGKPFKRLKTHMPHCKKAPGSQPKKTNHMSKELSKSPSRSKTLEDNNNEKLPIKSKMTGDLSSGATDQVSPSETLEMKTPKSNGLSKGQKEFERLQLVPVSQNSTKTSVKLSTKPDHVTSKHHTPKMPLSEGLSKTSSETIRSGTDPTILKKDSPANETSVQHELLKPKTKLEELERPTNKDFSLALQAKEHQTLKKNIIFTSKTSVWDHISDSLYKKKYVVPLVNIEPFKFSAVEDRRISAVLQSNNKGETNLPKVFVPLPILSSSHRPTEDICGSRQGRVSSPVPEPAADGNRIQFSTVNHNKGWQCYLRKYRGRIGGITMLLAGCCVLSYVWSLPHQKKDR